MPEVLDTLPKPFEFDQLEERIRRCLASGAGIEGAAETAEAGDGAADPAQAAVGTSDPTAPALEPELDDDDGWVEIAPR